MISEQFAFYDLEEVKKMDSLSSLAKADLVLMFGSKKFICSNQVFEAVRSKYQSANILGCTTAGEIFNDQVNDNILTITAIKFEKTETKFFSVKLADSNKSYEKGLEIANLIPKENLSHVFVISEGLNLNGSKLVDGFTAGLPEGVKVTGGLAADDERYMETFVIANGHADKNLIAAVAFYGDNIKIGYGSVGGWDTFGIERTITKAKENILYELDGKPALDLYAEYLGEYAKDLPASGLFFPLNIRSVNNKYNVVRTVSSIDKKERSLTFAGEIPEGYRGRLMRANYDNLINGAMNAGEDCITSINYNKPKLAILVSCCGRKFILNQRIDEEIEVVREIFGKEVIMTGFYSYGEIAPMNKESISEFHNQTMTITLIGEE